MKVKKVPSGRERVISAIRLAEKRNPGHSQELPQILNTQVKDVEQFLAVLEKSKASFERLSTTDKIPEAVAKYCSEIGVEKKIAVSPELSEMDWSKAGIAAHGKWQEGLSAAVTGCRAALSETGQFAVDNEGEDAWLSLVATVHVVVIKASVLRSGLGELASIAGERPPSQITLIHGPSRTGDIEQTLVLGAHGPKKVHALYLDNA